MENGTVTNTETAANGQVENNTNTQAEVANTQSTTNQSTVDVDALRKAREQAEMRANQLANELKKKEQALAEREKADEELQRKKLEENEEFKTLYERSEERAKELEQKIQQAEVSRDINNFKVETRSQYPDSVLDLVDTAGIDLNDNSDEAKESYKNKLDAIAAKINTGKKVTGNNIPNNTPNDNAASLATMRSGNARERKDAASKIIGEMSFIKEMKKQAEES